MSREILYPSPQIDSTSLWSMDRDAYNAWRRKNDFPRILEYFKSRCTKFPIWQQEYSVSDEALLDNCIAPFLKDDGLQTAHQVDTEHGTSWVLTKKQDLSDWFYENNRKIRASIRFVPYQRWCRNKHIKAHQRGHEDRIMVRTWTGLGQAYLFGELELLKIGNITINHNPIGGRHFQFTNADDLTLDRRTWSNQQCYFDFGTASGLKLIGDKAFLNFYEMSLDRRPHWESDFGIALVDGHFQDLHFKRCGVHLEAREAFIHRCSFVDCSINAFLDKAKFHETDFVQNFHRIESYGQARSIFRFAKDNYGSQKNWEEASKYSLKEKWCEAMMVLFDTYYRPERYASQKIRATIANLIRQWRREEINSKKFRSYIEAKIWFSVRNICNPIYFGRYILTKLNFAFLLLNIAVWGAGERPNRVIPTSAIVMVLFALVYYLSPTSITAGDFWASVDCSISSFATMNAELSQNDLTMRLVTNVEAILGILALGLLVGGYSSRNRTY